MTPEAIRRVQASHASLGERGDALASAFYRTLFVRAPELRRLFPEDLTSLKGHFDSALALVIRNLSSINIIEQSLRDLGAQHVHWGARPEDYVTVRESLITALESLSGGRWNAAVERDWRDAITVVCVAMLQGAAVETALYAERLTQKGG